MKENKRSNDAGCPTFSSFKNLVTTKARLRLHRENISKGPILTKLEGFGKVNIPVMCPGRGFPRRVSLDSYNMRKMAGKRFLMSQRNCNSSGAEKVASFIYFHHLSVPPPQWTEWLAKLSWPVNVSFFVDQASCLPFSPGKFIYSLSGRNSGLNCKPEHLLASLRLGQLKQRTTATKSQAEKEVLFLSTM